MKDETCVDCGEEAEDLDADGRCEQCASKPRFDSLSRLRIQEVEREKN